MELQGRNLSRQMSGEDVKLLHQELQKLGYTIDKAEVSQNYFGQSTDKIVKTFQQSENLKITGVVDEETAKLINLKVDARQPQRYLVRGYVTQSDGTTTAALVGATVRVFDWDIRDENFLGETTTNTNGYYQITYTEEQFRKSQNEEGGADLIVRVYNSQGQLLATSPRKNNAQPEETIDLTVTVLAQPSPQDDVFVVKGTVNHANGTILSNIAVRVFDRDMRSRQFLTAPRTNQEGYFEGTYTRAQFTRAEKQNADLVFELIDPNEQIIQGFAATDETGNPLPSLPTSDVEGNATNIPIWFNAPQVATVNFTVTDSRYQGASEFRRYLEETRRIAENILPQDWTEEDIAFLAGETSIPAERLRFLRLDAQWRDRYDIEPAAFYGLFRQNLPANLTTLLLQEPEEWRAALARSLQENLIPQTLEPLLDEIIARLQELLPSYLAETPTDDEEVKPLTNLLATVLPEASLRRQFAVEYANYNGEDEEAFWANLQTQAGFQNGLANDIRFTFQASPLTYNHLPLVQALQEERQQGRIQSVRDLVRFDEFGWRNLLETTINNQPVGVPEGVPGNTPDEQQHNYIQALLRLTEAVFPTPAIAARLERDNDLPERQDLLTFINNNPDFDLGATSFRRYVLDRGDDVLSGVQNPEAIASAQRIFKLAPRYELMKPLLANRLDSALAISLVGETQFIANYAQPLGGTVQAKRIYQQAQRQTALSLAVFAKYHTTFDRVRSWMIPAQSPTLSPDWEFLFGSLTSCECEHCRSIYSPAAYLVDGLNFLQQAQLLEAFQDRRPDIGELQLTCDNTHTPLPFIDLVNEVLENAVISQSISSEPPQPLQPPLQDAEGNLNWPQTRSTAEELLAAPEYTFEGAYLRLSETIYPADLPFDLWLATARVYLKHLGSSREEVMRLFQRRGSPSEDAIAWEALGLSPNERAIIVGIPSIGDMEVLLPQFYGYPSADDATLVRNLSQPLPQLLRRAQLEYRELLAILDSQFVNPERIVLLDAPEDADCNLEDYRLAKDGTSDDEKSPLDDSNVGFFERLYRFLRLHRALGGSIPELDWAIQALGDPASEESSREVINDNLLRKLVDLQFLADKLRLSVEEVLSFWAQINTQGENPLYQRLFQNKLITNPVNPNFALREDRSDLENPLEISSNESNEKISAILAAFRIGASDFEALTRSEINENTLNLADLSKLYRYVLLARSLRLRIPDLLNLRQLVDVNPFESPAKTKEFVTIVNSLKQSRFKLVELAYLYLHDPDAAAILEPDETQIRAIVRTLRSGLQGSPETELNSLAVSSI